MMDIILLKKKLVEKGMSIPTLAKKMNVSKKLIYSRMQGKTSFTQKEISSISEILNLRKEEILGIFFSEKVS